ncbi:hypothetical protein QBC34DRAFT_415457 [Podospora aff. communis PSN243]|uniref:Uncharacterized protein n=1 Tax=Podospora aff. communis PSN243 TaxID=3040156 RepID=A0AAV9G811_9PEZI|nr:hypothetical protein QBC34DRAFT_415457 [Podospora aff. communis PSN243]
MSSSENTPKKEAYVPPTAETKNSTTNTTTETTNTAPAARPAREPSPVGKPELRFMCGACGTNRVYKITASWRCEVCGHRILLKPRTKRPTQWQAV